MHPGERLRRFREQAGLSQTDLAKAGGVSRSYISMIEAGKVRPSPGVMEAFANHLDVPVEALIGKADEAGDRALVENLLAVSAKLADHGDFRNAKEQLEQAVRISLRVDDPLLEALARETLADLLEKTEDFHGALGQLEKATQAIWQSSNKPVLAGLAMRTGRCYYMLGQYALADSHLNRANAYLPDDDSHHQLQARIYRNLGNNCCGLGKHEDAAGWYEKSAQLSSDLADDEYAAHAYLGLSYSLPYCGRAAEALDAAKAEEFYSHIDSQW